MSEQQQRMAAVETDKELSDLLDFSAVRQWDSRLGDSWVAPGRSIKDGVFGVWVRAGFRRFALGKAEILPVCSPYSCQTERSLIFLKIKMSEIYFNRTRYERILDDLIEKSLVWTVKCTYWIGKRMWKDFHPCFLSAPAFVLLDFQVL